MSPSPRRIRNRHRKSVCSATGKVRYRDRKDARIALRDARMIRARAALHGVTTTWHVVALYRCDAGCGGFHTTSRPASSTVHAEVTA